MFDPTTEGVLILLVPIAITIVMAVFIERWLHRKRKRNHKKVPIE